LYFDANITFRFLVKIIQGCGAEARAGRFAWIRGSN